MILIFVVNIAICLWLQIGLGEIAIAHLYLVAACVVGKSIIRCFRAPVSSEYAVVGSTIVGVVAYTIFAAVVFHFTKNSPALTWLFFLSMWLPVLIQMALFFQRAEETLHGQFIGTRGVKNDHPEWMVTVARLTSDPSAWFKSDQSRSSTRGIDDWAKFSTATLSLVIAAGTFYGFVDTNSLKYQDAVNVAKEAEDTPEWLRGWQLDTQISTWGSTDDKATHLVRAVDQVAHQGFPHENFLRRGVQLLAMPPALGYYLYDTDSYIRIYKVLAFYIWFALLYTCYATGKEVFGVSGIYLLALVFASVLYGAIVYPLYQLTGSTYGGFAKPTLGCFHNLTQLVSLTVGSAGLYFAYGALQNRTAGLGLGLALITASFFFKPSFFTIAAPAFTLVILLAVALRKLPLRAIGSLAILFIVPVTWKLYQFAITAPSYSLSPVVKPFETYFGRAAPRFPEFVTENLVLFAFVILLLSYLFPLLVAIGKLLSYLFSLLMAIGNWRNAKAVFSSLITPVILLMFIFGTVTSFLLVENNARLMHGNFAWGGQAAYFVVLPLAFHGFQNLPSKWFRTVCWLVLLLHIYAGIQHLYHFVVVGSLM